MKINYELNQWESNFFNRDIYLATIESSFLISNKPDHIELAQIKINAKDIASIELLQKHNFKFVEGEINFKINLSENESHINSEIKIASSEDFSALSIFCEEINFQTRIRTPYYSQNENKKFYAEWFKNAVLKQYDDICFIVIQSEKIVGAITVKLIENNARIGLLAVSPQFQGKNIGKALIKQAIQWAKEKNAQYLFIATQINNINAINLYQKFKPSIADTYYWFYQHGDKNDSI